MRNLLLAIFCLFIIVSVFAQKPDATFNVASFNTPDNEPFAETYILINPNSLKLKKTGGEYTAGAEITILFRQGEDIVNFDKFDLVSTGIKDTGVISYNLLGARRIAVPNGNYAVEVNIKDLNDPNRSVILPVKPVNIDFNKNVIAFSDIQLVDSMGPSTGNSSLHKNNYYLSPHPLDFFSSSENEIKYYSEIYFLNSQYPDQDLLVTASVRRPNEVKPAGNFQQYYKQKGQPVNIILGRMNISDLPTGNYELVLEVRDKGNNLIAQKKHFFQRSNRSAISAMENLKLLDIGGTFVSDYTEDQLNKYLPSLKPVATQTEARVIDDLLAMKDKLAKQQFLYNFWLHRDIIDPQGAWQEYLGRVNYAHQEFSTSNRKGYETDRGRVFLQYGRPTEISKSSFEADSKPFEVWQYNRIHTNEINVIFVFYNEDLISNDFRLLHSNATGEIRNERWKQIVHGQYSNDLENNRAIEGLGNDPVPPYNH